MSLLRVFSPRPLLSLSISLVYSATRHFFSHAYVTAKLQKRTDDDDDSENISVSNDEMIIVFNSGKRETLSLFLSLNPTMGLSVPSVSANIANIALPFIEFLARQSRLLLMYEIPKADEGNSPGFSLRAARSFPFLPFYHTLFFFSVR